MSSVSNSVVDAGGWLIRFGSIDRAEAKIIKKYKITFEEAQDVVAEAAISLVASAPKEIRSSFNMVIAYHRWNHMYEKAVASNNMSEAIEAQKQLDKLLMKVH